MQASSLSLMTPMGYQTSDCGYCKAEDETSASYYAKCRSLSVDTYQSLIDRGWRRSGSLLYKPDVFRACCPHYTIRLPAAALATSRDQRQALHRWNKFVLGDDYMKEVAKRFPKTKEEKARLKHGFDMLHTLHEAEVENLKPVEPSHKFEVTLEPDTFTEEKFRLYKSYQVKVHHDKPNEDGKDLQLGSYHQCYRLDGKLIAIGVLDLLPHAVSGVYFIYDPDFEKWSFGKLSALREAALAIEGGYEFYYMGYYIHNCVKMRYKGDYKPQYVLDPETYSWDPLDERLRGLLDQKKYVSLSRESQKGRGATRASGSSADAGVEQVDNGKESKPDPTHMAENDAGQEYPFHSPKDAVNSQKSLLSIGMPGIPNAEELQRQIDLDDMKIFIRSGKGMIVKLSDIQSWEDGDILDASSLKGLVAEFAACIGPEAAKGVIIDFSG